MESLGQTLCQLEKTFLNQQLGSEAEFFAEKDCKKTAQNMQKPAFLSPDSDSIPVWI